MDALHHILKTQWCQAFPLKVEVCHLFPHPYFMFVLFSGLSNIIGIIVYISSNAGDPSDKKDEDKKNQYNYGWSFYFGALSFIVAESVGVLAVNIYIEKNKETRFRAKHDFIKTTSSSSPYSRIPSYRYRRRRSRSSSRSTDPSREPSPVGMKTGGGSGGGALGMGLPMGDISLYSLSRDPLKGGSGPARPYSPESDTGFLQVHNCFQKEVKNGANRRTTPVWGQQCIAVFNNSFTETLSMLFRWKASFSTGFFFSVFIFWQALQKKQKENVNTEITFFYLNTRLM